MGVIRRRYFGLSLGDFYELLKTLYKDWESTKSYREK